MVNKSAFPMHLLSKQHGFIVLLSLSFEIIKCEPVSDHKL
jgi:hypothetical protein